MLFVHSDVFISCFHFCWPTRGGWRRRGGCHCGVHVGIGWLSRVGSASDLISATKKYVATNLSVFIYIYIYLCDHGLVYLCTSMRLYFVICVYVCMHECVCLGVCLSNCVSTCLSVCLSVSLFELCVCVCLWVWLSECAHVHLPFGVFVYLFA